MWAALFNYTNTQTTYELIKDEFVYEPRGTVDVKGKGEMEVWQVTGAKDSEAQDRVNG